MVREIDNFFVCRQVFTHKIFTKNHRRLPVAQRHPRPGQMWNVPTLGGNWKQTVVVRGRVPCGRQCCAWKSRRPREGRCPPVSAPLQVAFTWVPQPRDTHVEVPSSVPMCSFSSLGSITIWRISLAGEEGSRLDLRSYKVLTNSVPHPEPLYLHQKNDWK